MCLTFQDSVESVIRRLAGRDITTKVYHAFGALVEAISLHIEFDSLAINQLFMFCNACYYDQSHSLGRPLLRHWLTNMGGLIELVSPISTRLELTMLVCLDVYG
jgi:hypothetical protein